MAMPLQLLSPALVAFYLSSLVMNHEFVPGSVHYNPQYGSAPVGLVSRARLLRPMHPSAAQSCMGGSSRGLENLSCDQPHVVNPYHLNCPQSQKAGRHMQSCLVVPATVDCVPG